MTYTQQPSDASGGRATDPSRPRRRSRLGIAAAIRGFAHDGGVYVHASLGRVVDRLAQHFHTVTLCIPLSTGPPDASSDYRITSRNIKLISQPGYRNMLGALKNYPRVAWAYIRTILACDVVLVRGIGPGVAILHPIAACLDKRIVQWIVGDPVALLRTHKRHSKVRDAVSLCFALATQTVGQIAVRLSHVVTVVNGQALRRLYPSRRTRVTVSSAISESELYRRDDTCTGPVLRVLFVGFIRPEKGVEYLIEALPQLRTRQPWELVLVGSSDSYSPYKRKLDGFISRFGIGDRVRWIGHKPYGIELFEQMRTADVLVLPTLSEGTPRVLVDARGNSVPIVATRVGGIPTSVTDGVDGLLVPPKDAAAIARAIDRIASDGAFRRRLIAAGYAAARNNTVEAFADRLAAAALWNGRVDGRAEGDGT